MVKPEDREKHQEQARLSALYKNGFTGSPGRMDYLYFVNGYRSKLFIVWTSKKIRRSIRKRNKIMSIQRNNSVGKEQFTALPENPPPKCVVCHGPHQVTSKSIANRCEISKMNELCYRCLRSGHQGKNCPENNGCGINDCKGTHHFHVHFECRYKPPERVDICRNAKRLWRL